MAHKLVWNRAVADANGRIAVRARWNRPLGLPQNSPLVCHQCATTSVPPLGLPQNSPLVCHHWQPLVCGHLDPIVGSNQWFLGGSCVAAIPDRFLPCRHPVCYTLDDTVTQCHTVTLGVERNRNQETGSFQELLELVISGKCMHSRYPHKTPGIKNSCKIARSCSTPMWVPPGLLGAR